jgi:hypothetical protein
MDYVSNVERSGDISQMSSSSLSLHVLKEVSDALEDMDDDFPKDSCKNPSF